MASLSPLVPLMPRQLQQTQRMQIVPHANMQRRVGAAGRKRLHDYLCAVIVLLVLMLYITTSPMQGFLTRKLRHHHGDSVRGAQPVGRDAVALSTDGGGAPRGSVSVWHDAPSIPYLNGTAALDPRKQHLDASVVLVVNVASHCGFTEMNYRELSRLFVELHDKALPFRILAFPCNQFGGQESDPPEAILRFADLHSRPAQFDMMEKVDVNGPQAHPLYQRLKALKHIDAIQWNFAKFLIGKNGRVLSYYDTHFPLALLRAEVYAAFEPSY